MLRPQSPGSAPFVAGMALVLASTLLGLALAAEATHSTVHEGTTVVIGVLVFLYSFRWHGYKASLVEASPPRSRVRRSLMFAPGIAVPFLFAPVSAAYLLGSGAGILGGLFVATIGWFTGMQTQRVWAQALAGPQEGLPANASGAVLTLLIVLGIPLFLASSVARAPQGLFPTPVSVPAVQLTVGFSGYILGGIIALGVVRFVSVSHAWTSMGGKIGPGLAGHWFSSVALQMMLLAASCLVFVMMWLSDIAALPGAALGSIFHVMVRGVALVLSLFATGMPPASAPRSKRNVVRGHHWLRSTPASHDAFNWWIVIGGCVVALLLVLLILYAIRNNTWWINALRHRRSRRMRVSSRTAAQSDIGRVRQPEYWRRLFPGFMTPRERILRDYEALLRRTAQHGIQRARGITASEFSSRLEVQLPQAGDDVEQLTAAFIEARYSQHTLGEPVARRVHRSWQHVRAALNGTRSSNTVEVTGD